MTIIFNFFGGPGTGKSTSATYCFAMSKDAQVNSEYVSEVAKEWAWEKRHISLLDQFELFKKQTDREKRLFHETEVVFSDSPVWLSSYYASLKDNLHASEVFKELCQQYYLMTSQQGVRHINIWLTRVKPYNPKGRFQNEAQAKDIDAMMKPFLESLGVQFIVCPGVKEEAWELVKGLLEQNGVFSETD